MGNNVVYIFGFSKEEALYEMESWICKSKIFIEIEIFL